MNRVKLATLLIVVGMAFTAQAEEAQLECVEGVEVRPYSFGQHLYVNVRTTLTDGCFERRQGWFESWPPQLFYYACKEVEKGQVCTQQIRELDDWYSTSWSPKFEELRVHFGDGSHKDVPVIHVPFAAGAADNEIPIPFQKHVEGVRALANGFGPIPLTPEQNSRRAIGVSYDLSFDEAFQNALNNLAAEGGTERVDHAVVLETGYFRRGFVDDYLYVLLEEKGAE